jgi:hypothetical protein
MKKILFGVSCLVFTARAGIFRATSYGQSLEDCETVAAQFSNTCSGTPSTAATWDSTFSSETVTCSQTTCPTGYGTAPSCSWERKLCVTCSESSSKVYMRIQSNGLPDHCYSTPSTSVESTIDFTILFNPDTSSTSLTTFDSQDDYDTAVCTTTKTSDLPSSSELTDNGSSITLTVLAAVALNGVPIFASSSAENVDPFYPNDWSGAGTITTESVDACLGHPQGNGIYHYHMLSPCILNSADVETTKSCSAVSACSSDVRTYTLDLLADYQDEYILGVARDGHLLMNPYNKRGKYYDCADLD